MNPWLPLHPHRSVLRTATRRRRGLTLVELMVAMTVLLILIGLVMYILMLALKSWGVAERERDAHDRAMGALDIVRNDVVSIALPGSHSRSNVIMLYGDEGTDPDQVNSFMYFVRTIETGRERAQTYLAADGAPSPLKDELPKGRFQLPQLPAGAAGGGSVDQDPLRSADDSPIAAVGYDYSALGGIMEVAYIMKGRKLYRYFNSPVNQPFTLQKVFPPDDCSLVLDNVLFFHVEYWSPLTSDWNAAPLLTAQGAKGGGASGPLTAWDSTRMLSSGRGFPFFANQAAQANLGPPRPIFPQRVKITLVLDWNDNFSANTYLADDITANDGAIRVASAEDLPDGGRDDSYVLIGKEWIRYSAVNGTTLVIDPKDAENPGQRGARGTVASTHIAGDPVRFGRTFAFYISLPQGDFVLPEGAR
ncbi:MAG TPA: prepilin-type N-terminal cleavage/methylation domain-containing protein [Planctomycetota bacterium]|nr:prepilin-type N-terminal cleavage/methylation domain-containing protein [Planctomycetota bacterium]